MATAPAKTTTGSNRSTERFVRESGIAASVAGVVEPVLESLGFRLVREPNSWISQLSSGLSKALSITGS